MVQQNQQSFKLIINHQSIIWSDNKQAKVYFSAAPVATDQNRAYLRHLENHKKFDTLRGDRGIDDCEICQIMKKQLEAEKQDSGYVLRACYSWLDETCLNNHVVNLQRNFDWPNTAGTIMFRVFTFCNHAAWRKEKKKQMSTFVSGHLQHL